MVMLGGAIVPGILGYLSCRRQAAPLWVRAVVGGALVVASILVALVRLTGR